MRLYKNVDICDLQKIMAEGILPVAVTGNDNWNGHRNSTDPNLVYLFEAFQQGDTFPKSYGAALIEVDTDARENAMTATDAHRNDYIEYVTDKVTPGEIVAVHIPEIFRSRIPFSDDRIQYCGISANVFDANAENYRRPINAAELKIVADTAKIMSANQDNFFRGVNPDRTVIDLYDIKYVF